MLGTHYDDTFTIPGTQSQQGQDVLADRFGLTGANGQVLYTSERGPITAGAAASAVGDAVEKVNALDGVAVSNPLTADDPLVSRDGRSTIASLRFTSQTPSDALLDRVLVTAKPDSASGVKALVGGDAYKSTGDPSRVPELLGLLVSFFIIAVALGSSIAAGMPILGSAGGAGAQPLPAVAGLQRRRQPAGRWRRDLLGRIGAGRAAAVGRPRSPGRGHRGEAAPHPPPGRARPDTGMNGRVLGLPTARQQ